METRELHLVTGSLNSNIAGTVAEIGFSSRRLGLQMMAKYYPQGSVKVPSEQGKWIQVSSTGKDPFFQGLISALHVV